MINPDARTWTSPITGIVLRLQPVSAGLMSKIQSDRRGKPTIPTQRVNYGTTTAPEWGTELNPDDPNYKDALETWQSTQSTKVAIYVISTGVLIDVPPEFASEIAEWDDTASLAELKYFYITKIIPSDELGDLTNAILSQTVPTEDGIAQATAGFSGNS